MLTATFTTAVLLLTTTTRADALPPPPDNPSDQDISQSQTDAAAVATEVGRLSAQVAMTEGDIQRLSDDLALKAELANKAAVDLDLAVADVAIADQAAADSAQDAKDAQGTITLAQTKADGFAAASFRQGSQLGSISALLDAGSVTDVLGRQQLLNAISKSQLNVISDLQLATVAKANLDAAARQRLLDADAARATADAAKVTSDQANTTAAEAFAVGQATLTDLQTQLVEQQLAYNAAANTVQTLQDKRTAYDDWLVLKAAEEERLRQEAKAAAEAEAARVAAEQAEAARVAAEQAESARVAAEAQAAAETAQQQQAAAQQQQAAAEQQQAAAEQQQAAAQAAAQAERQAARDAIALQEQAAARAAAESAAAAFYDTCDAARAAGRGPINKGESGYRAELDPNSNGVACEGKTSTPAVSASTVVEEFYVTCDTARAAGRGPINKGESGYRAELDPNSNGVACEGQAVYAATLNSAANTGTTGNSSSPAAPVAAAPSGDRRQIIVDAAKRWIGTTYAWGGGNANGPTLGIRDGGTADSFGDYRKVGFDCSGLTIFAYAQVGINLPHYSGYQYNIGSRIARDNLQPGDLMFWANNTSDPTTIHHVAIYMGNNQMVEAQQSGTYVKISPVRWNGYIGATRPGA